MKLKVRPRENKNGEGSSSLGFTTLVSSDNKDYYHQLTYVLHKNGHVSGAYSTQQDMDYFLGFTAIKKSDKYIVQWITSGTSGVKFEAQSMHEVCVRLGQMIAPRLYPKAKDKVLKQRKAELIKWTEKAINPAV